MNQCNKCPQDLDFCPVSCHTIGVKQREHPVTYQLEINFGQGWEATCYRPMDRMDADQLAGRLGRLYTEYSYRVVKV